MTAAGEHVLCRLEEIADGGSRGFVLGEGSARREIFLVREAGRVFGYVNACPHTGGPLDWVEDQFISEDRAHIQCATHGALFRIVDGHCLAGPCAGAALTPVPLRIDAAGRVVLVTG